MLRLKNARTAGPSDAEKRTVRRVCRTELECGRKIAGNRLNFLIIYKLAQGGMTELRLILRRGLRRSAVLYVLKEEVRQQITVA